MGGGCPPSKMSQPFPEACSQCQDLPDITQMYECTQGIPACVGTEEAVHIKTKEEIGSGGEIQGKEKRVPCDDMGTRDGNRFVKCPHFGCVEAVHIKTKEEIGSGDEIQGKEKR